MVEIALTSRVALHGIDRVSRPDCGVTIRELDGFGFAAMLARRPQAHLSERIREQFKIELPARPSFARVGETGFIGTGPGSWLAIHESGGCAFSASLRNVVAPLASVIDQSSGYAIFRVGGAAIRKTLAKGFPLDFHSAAFQIGDAATTAVSHIGALVWRCDDALDGQPTFDIAVFRSFAHSFWNWFESSAEEFGCGWQEVA